MTKAKAEIRHNGRSYPIIDQMSFGHRKLCVLQRLGSPQRPVFQVLERGLVGQMRCLHVLPYSPETVQRLKTLTRVSAPQANLPTVIESLRQREHVYVLTRWIDGPLLSDFLSDCRRGREPWPSVFLAIKLIRGLAHACQLLHHRLGLVHGDIHPGNLVICRHTKQLVPIDYGSAWSVERTLHRGGQGAMRSYAAPEALGVDNAPPGFRSDQFSVMVVCYEMLTGEIPYDRLGGRAALTSLPGHQQISLVAPSGVLKHQGQLPPKAKVSLDRLLKQGLALDPAERFQSDGDWLDALNGCFNLLKAKPMRMPAANRWLLRQLGRLETLFSRGLE